MTIDRSARILSRLRHLERSGQPPPTIRELATTCGISSTSIVKSYLEELRDAGLVTWDPYKARTLRTTAYQDELARQLKENARLKERLTKLGIDI